eukprot:jgi/Mesvir1/21705/Mv04124-RA.1
MLDGFCSSDVFATVGVVQAGSGGALEATFGVLVTPCYEGDDDSVINISPARGVHGMFVYNTCTALEVGGVLSLRGADQQMPAQLPAEMLAELENEKHRLRMNTNVKVCDCQLMIVAKD